MPVMNSIKNTAIAFAGIALTLISSPTTLAAMVLVDEESVQGNTLAIEVPKHDINEISGTFNGKEIKFFPIERTPKPEEEITRAEFLEMMFLNHDFSEELLKLESSGSETSESPAEEPPEEPEEEQFFPDVDPGNPYYEYIQNAHKMDIIHGYKDGKFHPYLTITRGQAAKILVEAFDPPVAIEKTVLFADVPDNHRFYNYVNDAIQARWFRGYPDGLMRPDRHINFLEAEIVIKRAAVPEEFIGIGEKPYYKAFAGIHRTASTGTQNLEISTFVPGFDTQTQTVGIDVQYRNVPTVRFSLAKEDTDLFGDDAQQKTWDAVYGAIANPTGTRLWNGTFIVPTIGEITLGYGDKLYINGNYSGTHFGIDYANKTKPAINAANSGKVTLAEYTPAFGNTVVIDHGLNVFTMYIHMSELAVTANQFVDKGEKVGVMGSTGISSGDHLHYTQFIGDVIVDPEQWYHTSF
jgi:murein DD-endopeptidase MepM/ murein hydrolase activator NlpD